MSKTNKTNKSSVKSDDVKTTTQVVVKNANSDVSNNANDKTQTSEQSNKITLVTRDVFNNSIARERSHTINMTILNAFKRHESLTIKQIEAQSQMKAVRAHISHLIAHKHVRIINAKVVVDEETHKTLYDQRKINANALKFIK